MTSVFAPLSEAIEFTELVDLAAERLGGAVLWANDEFFADKDNLLKPDAAVFVAGRYTDRGKWMDGWETRRRRTPGHDWCIVRLGVPGVVRGVVVDTSHFKGNFPESCSLEACSAPSQAPLDALEAAPWHELLPRTKLHGDARNAFPIERGWRATHVRLRIHPDGGVARLRVHGDAVPEPRWLGRAGVEQDVDLAAVEHGGIVVAASDTFFGPRHALVMPGRAHDMSDGWETRRTRREGPEWVLVKLAAEGTIHRVELDTWRFKGNAPESAALAVGTWADGPWQDVLPRARLLPHTRHVFDGELAPHAPARFARLSIWPDGGVSRLRLIGAPSAAGREAWGVARLDALAPDEAHAELLACCGSAAWAKRMCGARPFRDLAAVKAEAARAADALTERDWLEAFAAHPRIGEKKADARGWAAQEQSRVSEAGRATLDGLAEANHAYEAKFGFLYVVCATGKSAEEMLALARERLEGDRARELVRAAEEQRKITDLRLARLVSP
ncbi:MAG TPA: allantoicase [Polyangiaceae bacterium]|jgi:allantoicase